MVTPSQRIADCKGIDEVRSRVRLATIPPRPSTGSTEVVYRTFPVSTRDSGAPTGGWSRPRASAFRASRIPFPSAWLLGWAWTPGSEGARSVFAVVWAAAFLKNSLLEHL